MPFTEIVLAPTYSSTLRNTHLDTSTGEGMILLKDCLLDAGIWLRREKNITVQEQNQSRIKRQAHTYSCITLHYSVANCAEEVGSDGTNLQTIYKSNCYCNDNIVREKINKVDAMDGNTASIEGQGLNVRSQHRNKQSAG